MADSDETYTKVTNEPGRLVWVCRPDGTWWPGQIISADKATNINLSPKRTGTPVKLLGKDDDDVDWYDVEASDQIKAFRCTEFDEYIEKANAILQALQLESAIKSKDELEHEMASPSVSERRFLLDLNRSPEYNMNSGLPDVTGCDLMKSLYEEPAIREHLPGSSSMCASGASQEIQLGCQENQIEARSNKGGVLDVDFTDNQLRGSGDYIGSCDDDDAPKNYGDQRSQGTLGPYKLREKPRASSKFEGTCPPSKKIKRLSSPVTGLPERVLEFENIMKAQVQCVPGSPSMHASGASQEPQVGFQGNQVEAPSNDVEALDSGFTDNQIKGSGGCDDYDDDAPKNYGDGRSHGTRGPYKLRAKPRGSSKFASTCPSPKKLKRVSTPVASEHTSFPKEIPEVKDIKKPSLQCVPVTLIESMLKEALR